MIRVVKMERRRVLQVRPTRLREKRVTAKLHVVNGIQACKGTIKTKNGTMKRIHLVLQQNMHTENAVELLCVSLAACRDLDRVVVARISLCGVLRAERGAWCSVSL